MKKADIRAFWNKNKKELKIIFEKLSKDETYHEKERECFKIIADNIGELGTKSRKFAIYDTNGNLIEGDINIRNIAYRLIEELDKIGIEYSTILGVFNNTQNIISDTQKSRFKEINLKSSKRSIWVSQNIGTTQPNFKGLEKAILGNNILRVEEEWK